jgi:hypothetical protein
MILSDAVMTMCLRVTPCAASKHENAVYRRRPPVSGQPANETETPTLTRMPLQPSAFDGAADIVRAKGCAPVQRPR